MGIKKSLESRVRGWLPKEPRLPSRQLEAKPRKFFPVKTVVLIVVCVIIAMLLVGAVFSLLLIPLMHSHFSDQTIEAQNTVNNYINALNHYDVPTAWGLMSPNMQASYGTIQNFTESFVNQLQGSGWHAQIIKNTFEYGTIAEYSLVPMQNSCQILLNLRLTRSNSNSTNETFAFELKTYAFSHNAPSNWKIDSKFAGS